MKKFDKGNFTGRENAKKKGGKETPETTGEENF